MARSEIGDVSIIGQMVQACKDITGFLAGVDENQFYENALLVAAVCFKFVVLGECPRGVTPQTQAAFSEIRWRDICDMRNRIVHEHDRIDLVEVWQEAKKAPALLKQLDEVRWQLSLKR
jgi:uncharacterized protein with HEPN domain